MKALMLAVGLAMLFGQFSMVNTAHAVQKADASYHGCGESGTCGDCDGDHDCGCNCGNCCENGSCCQGNCCENCTCGQGGCEGCGTGGCGEEGCEEGCCPPPAPAN